MRTLPSEMSDDDDDEEEDVYCVIVQVAADNGRSLQPCSFAGKTASDIQTTRKLDDTSSNDSAIVHDQWKRSIVVSDVPEEISSAVITSLQLKNWGGRIDSYKYDAENRKVLATFQDAAGRLVVKCCTINR